FFLAHARRLCLPYPLRFFLPNPRRLGFGLARSRRFLADPRGFLLTCSRGFGFTNPRLFFFARSRRFLADPRGFFLTCSRGFGFTNPPLFFFSRSRRFFLT